MRPTEEVSVGSGGTLVLVAKHQIVTGEARTLGRSLPGSRQTLCVADGLVSWNPEFTPEIIKSIEQHPAVPVLDDECLETSHSWT